MRLDGWTLDMDGGEKMSLARTMERRFSDRSGFSAFDYHKTGT